MPILNVGDAVPNVIYNTHTVIATVCHYRNRTWDNPQGLTRSRVYFTHGLNDPTTAIFLYTGRSSIMHYTIARNETIKVVSYDVIRGVSYYVLQSHLTERWYVPVSELDHILAEYYYIIRQPLSKDKKVKTVQRPKITKGMTFSRNKIADTRQVIFGDIYHAIRHGRIDLTTFREREENILEYIQRDKVTVKCVITVKGISLAVFEGCDPGERSHHTRPFSVPCSTLEKLL